MIDSKWPLVPICSYLLRRILA